VRRKLASHEKDREAVMRVSGRAEVEATRRCEEEDEDVEAVAEEVEGVRGKGGRSDRRFDGLRFSVLVVILRMVRGRRVGEREAGRDLRGAKVE
jgi:hypothetical protein